MSFRDDLVKKAVEQWEFFGKDEGRNDKFIDPSGKTTTSKKTGSKTNPRKETIEPFSSRVADFWLAIPSKEYDDLVKDFAKAKGKLDGTTELAWSAAFISYCMQMAGAGAQFPYAAGHSKWIGQSIKNKKANKIGAAIVGFKPGEIPLAVGDLIGRPREAGITFDNADKKGFFTSHSDIVVAIDTTKKVAHVIGGNVGQSVSRATVKITSAGMLNDPGGWIVHIQNNITPPPAPVAGTAAKPKDAKVG